MVGFTELNNNLAVVEISFEKSQSIQQSEYNLDLQWYHHFSENEVNFKEFESCTFTNCDFSQCNIE
jgi:carbonic anhydrase